ncbi:MAG: lipoyl(octanoyl) transferase LipB, partial [Bacteroidetes bacterium]|nr:lipoyl(octanoyl) transferase LipB [Bacteroidota bacterium]
DTTEYERKHYLLYCEHFPVYTLGKNGEDKNLLISEKVLKEKKIDFYRINRGGDITYHGPGQVVGYPILDLDFFFSDIHKYLHLLEENIIRTLADFDIFAGRRKEATGVWLDADNPLKARKICAIGIRCSRWVTMHGFAFNVNTNLDYYDYIVPCGILDKAVTSMQKELGRPLELEAVKKRLKYHFSELFAAELI